MNEYVGKSAALLTGLMLVKKLLSILYKIPYQNIVGDAGFYVFQQIYPFIGLLMVLTGFAMPTVIGTLLAKNHYGARIKDKVKRTMWVFSLLAFSVLFLGNRQIALIMGDILLAPMIRVIGIHFLFIPPVAYLRGVLQSRPETLTKMGYSIIIEQIVRVSAVIGTLLVLDLELNNYYQVAHVVFITTLLAPIITMIYLYAMNPLDDAQTFLPIKEKPEFARHVFYLTISTGILLIFNLIDSFFVFNTLITSHTHSTSMVLKGVLERGLPLVQGATFFVGTLVGLTMTQIERAADDKQKKLAFTAGMFFILGLAVPATLGLIIVMPYMNQMLFGDLLGTRTLQAVVMQTIFYSVIVLLTAVLYQTGKKSYVQVAFLIGIVTKMLITTPLVNHFRIAGAAGSSVISLGLIMIILMFGSKDFFTAKLIATFFGIAVSATFMLIGLHYARGFLEPLDNGTRFGYLMLIVAMGIIGIAIYGIMMLGFAKIFKLVGKNFLIQLKAKRERAEELAKKRQRKKVQEQLKQQQKIEQQRAQELAEIERQQRIASLMQNRNRSSAVTYNEQISGRGHYNPEPSMQFETETMTYNRGARMRLDKFLKISRIIKRRQTAKEVADAGKIAVNDKIAKSSTPVQVGDEITLYYATRTLVVKVLEIKDSTKKEDAGRMFEIVSETAR